MKLTKRQVETLKAIDNGGTMLRGRFDRYWWQDSDELWSPDAFAQKDLYVLFTLVPLVT